MRDDRCKCGTDALGGCRVHNASTAMATERALERALEINASLVRRVDDLEARERVKDDVIRDTAYRFGDALRLLEEVRPIIGSDELHDRVEAFIALPVDGPLAGSGQEQKP